MRPSWPICAAIEAEIADLDDADKQAFLADMGMEEPGLDRLIRAAYKLLGLQTYFTAGVKEVRAWTIHVGDTAPQAAGVIHTDFERGFIRAQTIAYDDYIACKGEAGRQGGRQDARRRQGIRGQGWRRAELPVQRLTSTRHTPSNVPSHGCTRFPPSPASTACGARLHAGLYRLAVRRAGTAAGAVLQG